MQTFLPYPFFGASAAALDARRLGKQRVETLQILHALVLPAYGWQRHPAVAMWRGHVPASTAYGPAAVDEWEARGFEDRARDQLAEFAPQVVGREQGWLEAERLLPSWLGDPALHASHRSRQLAKDPAYYAPRFPDTAEDLEYVWPVPVETPPAPHAADLPVVRVAAIEPWRDAGLVGLPPVPPRGRVTPAWREQLQGFEDLAAGTVLAVPADDDPALLHLAEVTGPVAARLDGVDPLAVAVRFDGDVERAGLPVPAELQNPRRFFAVHQT